MLKNDYHLVSYIFFSSINICFSVNEYGKFMTVPLTCKPWVYDCTLDIEALSLLPQKDKKNDYSNAKDVKKLNHHFS